MNLFIDYVQPLTDWLQQNPRSSLFITFLIALTESLAIVGSIIPGSVTMTAIGILAGSGVMPIDLTLLAAILGAIVGDSLSYALGYYYSEHLAEIWPFKKYPKWLEYGKDFFKIHGGKSVLIGRFVGPLRSIIPVIAGILHMKQWRFFIANFLSAIGWSLLYIMPGAIIGAASHELSTESATRLFVLILILLAIIWLIGLLIKWGIKRINSFLKLYLHDLWIHFRNYPLLLNLYNFVTPKEEKDHYPTASLVLITCLCSISFIIIFTVTTQTHWFSEINLPVYLLCQSFNILLLKNFFIFCTQLTSPLTLVVFFLISACWFIYHKQHSALIYLFSLIIFTSLFGFLLTSSIYSPRPSGILVVMPGSSFPAVHLQMATALYGFILFCIKNTNSLNTNTIKSIVLSILGLSGLGSIYLGDYWFTDVLASYFSGVAICCIYYLFYRKENYGLIKEHYSWFIITPYFIGIFLGSLVSTSLYYQTLFYNHTPYQPQYSLSEKAWWDQKKPLLPIYQISRVGKNVSLLNIQYAGDLDTLQQNLEENGWQAHSESFLANLIVHMNQHSNEVKLPLLTQLYKNKPPTLIMTYTQKEPQVTLELIIWESNYSLTKRNKPIWIGSVHPMLKRKNRNQVENLINPLDYLFKNEHVFSVKQMSLPKAQIKTVIYPVQTKIILIKPLHQTKNY